MGGGDAVGNRDPFGLCPEKMGGDGKTKGNADCPEGSAGRRQYISGAAEATDDPLFYLAGGLEYKALKGAVAGAMAIASERLLGEAIAGAGFRKAIAGPGTRALLRDRFRLSQQYGGSVADWAKMTGSSATIDGKLVQIHWYENIVTGFRTEFKQNIPWLWK